MIVTKQYKTVKATKEQLIKEYKRIKKLLNLDKDSYVTRELFRKYSSISENQVDKLFNNYTLFKKLCEVTHTSEEATQGEFDFVKAITGSYLDETPKTSEDLDEPYENEEDDDSYLEYPLYSFNKVTKDYIFKFDKIPNIGKVITLPITQVHAILQAYSKFDGNPETITQIALNHSLPTFTLKKILFALGVTHDSLPITDAALADDGFDEDKELQELLALRKSSLHSKFQAETWKAIQTAANKWNHFEVGVLNPFRDILDTWNPIQISENNIPKAIPLGKRDKKQTFITTLSDLHFGVFTNKEYAYYSQKDWTIEDTVAAVTDYFNLIKEEILNMKAPPEKCIVLSLGDILHGIKGLTDKGTILETDPKGPLQFKIALNSVSELLKNLLTLFPKVEVKAVSGNHDSFADWVLFTAIEKAFSQFVESGRLVFDISMERWLAFSEGNSLFIMEHGYSPFYKAKVPSGDTSKEAYISRLIINEKQKRHSVGLSSPEHNYFVMGDRHHHLQKSYTGFEFIQLPTLVDNDLYADHLNLHNRPKQLAFILDANKGITHTINLFLD